MKILITGININNEASLYNVARSSGYAGSINRIDELSGIIDIGDADFRKRAEITDGEVNSLLIGILSIGCKIESLE